ncbi:MAG TPA: hypothetical protein VGI85_06420 [Chthoniobacterales bacterium]|jgi:hypothetical protein
MKNKVDLFRILILFASVCVSSLRTAPAESAPKFAGTPVALGGITTVHVPLSVQEQGYAGEGANDAPPYALASLAVPRNFDPKKPWPILIVLSTSDFKIQDRYDLARIYSPTALAQGWIAIAGDGPNLPRHDTAGWRLSMTLAALDALYKSFPGSVHWPVACAGYSGGAKRTGQLAPLFSLAGCRVIGIFLTGINVDTVSEGYREYHPGRAFLHTPIFISSGEDDKVATLQEQWGVKNSIERTGFDRVRLERFPQGHVVKRAHLRDALNWFRQLDRTR